MRKKINIISLVMCFCIILSVFPSGVRFAGEKVVYAADERPKVSDLQTPDIADRAYYSNGKSSYEEIASYAVNNMKNGNGVIDLSSYDIKVGELEDLVEAIYNKDLCLYNSISIQGYRYSYSENKVYRIFFYFNETKSQIQDKYNKIQAEVKNVKKELNINAGSMSQMEIALKIHDYLVLNAEYDYDTLNTYGKVSDESHKAYGILVNKIGVCDGYANAYKLLLHEYGIDSVVVISTSMSHAWNMVNIDGKYYQVDVTWDDPIINGKDLNGYVSHTYFMKNDSEFTALEHYGWDSLGLSATSTKYSNWYVSKLDNALYYKDGYWYYPNDNKIMKADINGNKSSVVKSLNGNIRLGYYNNRLYYSLNNYLYSCDTNGSSEKCEYIISKKYSGITGNKIYSFYIASKANFKFALIWQSTIKNDSTYLSSNTGITTPDTSEEEDNTNTDGVDIKYRTYIQSIGWLNYVKNGNTSGTVGQGKRLEAIQINVDGDENLQVSYSTHVQGKGWTSYVNQGEVSGFAGENKRLEAIKIKLTGSDKDKYDVYYRVHAESYGWLGWAKNDEPAGTSGYGKRLEAIEIVLIEKSKEFNGSTDKAYVEKGTGVQYRTHVQNIGWMNYVSDGALSGTTGEGKRLEAININITNNNNLGISYRTHVQDIGWMNYVNDGALSGTSGQGKRLEAIKIKLTGSDKDKYDVYYRVHAESYGWLGWAKNDEPAGTAGYGKRLEAIEIVIVDKNSNFTGSTSRHFVEK